MLYGSLGVIDVASSGAVDTKTTTVTVLGQPDGNRKKDAMIMTSTRSNPINVPEVNIADLTCKINKAKKPVAGIQLCTNRLGFGGWRCGCGNLLCTVREWCGRVCF